MSNAVELAIGCYSAAQSNLTAAALFQHVDAWLGGGASDQWPAQFVSGRLIADARGTAGYDYGTGPEGALAPLRGYRFYAATRDATGNLSAPVLSVAAATLDSTRPRLSASNAPWSSSANAATQWPAAFSVAQGACNYVFSVVTAASNGVFVTDNVPGALRGCLVLSTAPLADAFFAGFFASAPLLAGQDVNAALTTYYNGSTAVSLSALTTSRYYDAGNNVMRDIDETDPEAPFTLYPHIAAVDASGNAAHVASEPITVTVHDWTPASIITDGSGNAIRVTQGPPAAGSNYVFSLDAPCSVSDGRAGALEAHLVLADRQLNVDELTSIVAGDKLSASNALGAEPGSAFRTEAYAGGHAARSLAGLSTARYYSAAVAPFGYAAVSDAAPAAGSLVPHVLAVDPAGNAARAFAPAFVFQDRTAPSFAGFIGVVAAGRAAQLSWAPVLDGRSAPPAAAAPALYLAAFTSAQPAPALTAAQLRAGASALSGLAGFVSALSVADAGASTAVTYGAGTKGEPALAESTRHYFYAAAADAAGNLSAVAAAEAVTLDVTAPTFASLTVGAPGPYTIPLSWIAAADASDPAPDVVIAVFTVAKTGITAAEVLSASIASAEGFVSKVTVLDGSGTTSYVYGSAALGEAALVSGAAYYLYAVAVDAAGNAGAPVAAGPVSTQVILDTTGLALKTWMRFNDAANTALVNSAPTPTYTVVRAQTTAGVVVYSEADAKEGSAALNNYTANKSYANKNFWQINGADYNNAAGFTLNMWYKTDAPIGNSSGVAALSCKIFSILSHATFSSVGMPAITSIGGVIVSLDVSSLTALSFYDSTGGGGSVIKTAADGVALWNNQWRMITLVHSPAAAGNYTAVYHDGAIISTRPACASLNTGNTYRSIRVGFNSTASSTANGHFNAKYDDFRYYNTPLSAQYIGALYNQSI